MSIFDKIYLHKIQNLPFVAYKKPNENKLTAFFQKDNLLLETSTFSESGFVFCSFDGSQNAILEESACDIFSEDIEFAGNEFSINHNIFDNIAAKKSHVKLVQSAINKINSSDCTKIVISRKETITLEIDAITLFKKMLFFNPTAFAYIWFHPKIGFWMGAFGEQLLKIENNILSTMSLAGTQKIVKNQSVAWKEKEIKEQQIVTDFIVSALNSNVKNMEVSKAENIVSGNVVHLKSDISAQLKPNCNLNTIINSLHPTPAVCGFPRDESKKFIIKSENYNREFYAGFLGELNMVTQHSQTNLFVNLRCLKLNADTIEIFVGGGITKDSNPEHEWEETVQKSIAIKKLL